jgi:hypothetical protein
MTYLVNSNKYVVVERRNLETLEKELNFNMSGMVSDDTAQRIGRMIGAQTVITGGVTTIGDIYKFDLNILEVETARIQGIYTELIIEDQILSALIGRSTNIGQSFLKEQRNMIFYWLYFGINSSFGFHFYDTKNTVYNENKLSINGSLDLTLQITLRPFQYFAIQLEPTFTVDSMSVLNREYVYDSNNYLKYYYDTNYTFEHHSLIFPILFRGIFDQRAMTFSGLAGGYLCLPLGNIEFRDSYNEIKIFDNISYNYGLLFGLSFGLKIGQGNAQLNIRYAFDLADTLYKDMNIYKRSLLFLGIGYEYGLIQNTYSRRY